MTTQSTTYRPDIDGLRAVAVLAVIIYHAGLALPGGYVGVDVFFVISGYLITGLIARDLDNGTFSMRDFWKRRILRIWPAGFAMVFVVLATAIVVMMPRDLVETSRDAISQMFMTINITFWRTTDYFRPDSEMRPLLHCWSLAVEEQFYLFLPPLLVLIWGLGRRWVWGILISGTILSLALSVALLGPKPWATFYLLPTRAWEMAFGSMLALLPSSRLQRGLKSEGCAILGLGAILVPMFVYSSKTPFPGLAALPVCVGSFMLLATPESGVNRLLSTAPMRAIGLVSYSLYLWHWPIFAFLRYVEGRDLSLPLTLGALLATAMAGVLSWRFIEQPFRGKASRLTFGRTAMVAGVVLACGTAFAVVPLLTSGLPGRLGSDVQEYASPARGERRWLGNGEPMSLGSSRPAGDIRVLLIGDSHGAAISGALHEAATRHDVSGWAAIRTGTYPVPDPQVSRDAGWVDETVEWAMRNGVTDVLLCARWCGYLGSAIESQCGEAADPRCESEVLGRLASAFAAMCGTLDDAGIRLWALSEVPDVPDPVRAAVRAHALGEDLPRVGFGYETHLRNQKHVLGLLADPRLEDVRVWDLSAPFFGQGDSASRIRDARGVYYEDGNHINTLGASVVVDHLGDLLAEIRRIDAEAGHLSTGG